MPKPQQSKPQRPKRDNRYANKIRTKTVQELRRSNAAGPHKSAKSYKRWNGEWE